MIISQKKNWDRNRSLGILPIIVVIPSLSINRGSIVAQPATSKSNSILFFLSVNNLLLLAEPYKASGR